MRVSKTKIMAEVDHFIDRSSNCEVDIAIIGGGIAGLWSLARLSQLGYEVLLLEADSLGCEQTGASQGIIHGGTKYALTGKLTHSSQSIRQMPERWKSCLLGVGEIDLSSASILSRHQYLWSTQTVASRLSGFFASKVMQSRVQKLDKEQRIAPFNHARFSGEVYQLDEPVLDSLSVLESIRQQYADQIVHFCVDEITAESDYYQLRENSQPQSVQAGAVILTAGAGNEQLLQQLGTEMPAMQRRPLHMPMLKASQQQLPLIYAHCLGSSALPRLTITAYPMGDQNVWYLGGEIAEKGVVRSQSEQIRAAEKELLSLMPWLDFSSVSWSTLRIDRAEPKMPDGSRPSDPFLSVTGKLITAWPVKLAMTPLMADAIVDQIQKFKLPHRHHLATVPFMRAKTSLLPWQKVKHWHT